MALTFLGGIPLYEHHNTAYKPFSVAPVPETLKYIMPDGFGAVVNEGDKVAINTPIMKNDDGFCAFSSVSGVVTSVTEEYISVQNDGSDEFVRLFPRIESSVNELTRDDILSYIKTCGIVGSYSGVPVYKKLEGCIEKVNRLVISCVESDPCSGHVRTFASAHAEEIILGAKIIMFAMGIKKTVLAFGEKDTKTAAAFNKVKVKKDMLVSAFVNKKYPQGYDRLLVTSIYNVEVPFSLKPEQCGYLVMSAETVYNVFNCLRNGTAVYEKAMTFTGEGKTKPANIIARVGTPLDYLLTSLEADERATVVSGGVVNGKKDEDGVVTQNTNMLVAALPYRERNNECIRCARCASVCPMHLLPYKFFENHLSGYHEKNIELALYNCIECGCCSYTCPSGIDLLGVIRDDKSGKYDIEDAVDDIEMTFEEQPEGAGQNTDEMPVDADSECDFGKLAGEYSDDDFEKTKEPEQTESKDELVSIAGLDEALNSVDEKNQKDAPSDIEEILDDMVIGGETENESEE